MKLVALAAGVLGVPIENDYVPAPMVIGGTQVCNRMWFVNQLVTYFVGEWFSILQNYNFKSQSFWVNFSRLNLTYKLQNTVI